MQITAPKFDGDEIEEVRACLNSGWVTQGPKTSLFESLLARRHQVEHALATTSCTAALHLSILALGLKSGDEVIVPAFTWVTSAHCAEYVGAKAVFVDVDLDTFNIDPAKIEESITPRTRAIVAVHLFGLAAAMDTIMEIAIKHGLAVIEDAACAIGSKYKNDLIGSHSSLVVFSFHPRKVLTTGEGGMICTSNPEWASRLRRLREHGMSLSAAERHAQGGVVIENYSETGYNYRLTDLQAGLGLAQLEKLDEMVEVRRKQAGLYRESFESHPRILNMISDTSYGLTNFQSFWIRLDTNQTFTRNSVMVDMDKHGVTTRRGIMVAHREAACERFFTSPLPVSETLSDSTLILPIFHSLSESDQSQIIEVFLEALGK